MDFYQRMKWVCERIPYGRVATYGQLARLCKMPKNSRQAGYALREGLCGEGVPAHRVVNAAGLLSGAAHFETPDAQRRRLEEEGVTVRRTPKGYRVDLRTFQWQDTLEEAEELYWLFWTEGI